MAKLRLFHVFRRKVHDTSSHSHASHESVVEKTEFQRDSQLPTNTNRRPFLAQIDSPSGSSKSAEATNILMSSLEVFSNISMPALQIAATLLLESVDNVREILQDEDDLPTFAERMETLSSMVAEIDHQRRLGGYQLILDQLPNELHGLRNALFKKFTNSESHPNIIRKHTEELERIIGELSLALQHNRNRTGAPNQPPFLEQAFTLQNVTQSTSQAIRQRFDGAIIDTSRPGGGGPGGTVGSNNEARTLDQSFEKARIVTGGGAVGSGNIIFPSPIVLDALPPCPYPPLQRPAPQAPGHYDRPQPHFDPHHSGHPDTHHEFRRRHPSYFSPSRDTPSPQNVAEGSECSEYADSLTSTASKLDRGHSAPHLQDIPGADILLSVQETKSQIQQTV